MARRPIAFNNSSKTNNSIKKNSIEIGVASDNYANNPGGLTWFNGPDSTNQYVVYSDTYSLGMTTLANSKPVCWASGDMTDANILRMINGLPTRNNQAPFTTIASALAWVASSSVFNFVAGTIDEIVTNGLLLNLDATQKASYPGSGTTWYDLSGEDNHTVINIGTYNPSGYFDSVVSPGYASLLEFTTQITGNLATALSATSGGWSIEEWVLINDTTYPEAAAGTVVSDSAYSAGAIGFDWNHGQTGMSQLQMGASWNVNQASNYDVRGYISLNNQYHNYGSWYLRHMFWNRDTAKMGAYYNGVFQGDIDISVLNGYPISDGGAITWGQLYGWRHDGARAGMRVYNRVLSASEVLQNFNAQKSRFGL
jgi:hypothetical protein